LILNNCFYILYLLKAIVKLVNNSFSLINFNISLFNGIL
jgi:hypothetical protein